MTSSPTVPSGASTRPGAELEGARCLVTGGLGFIGSAVARRLVDVGASVVVVDSLVPQHGGDRGNLAELEADGRVTVVVADIGSDEARQALDGVDVVFNVAGQVSHLASMHEPLRDLDLNVRSHLAFLESLRTAAPGARRRADVDAPGLRPAALPARRRGAPDGAGRRQRRRQAGVRAVPPPLRPALRPATGRAPADQRVRARASTSSARISASSPCSSAGPCSARTSCCTATAPNAATASTSTTWSMRIVLCALTSEAVGEIFNLGHEDSLTLAEIARLTHHAAGDRGGITTVPFPDELRPHRHRQLPGRLRQGQAGARVGSADRLRRGDHLHRRPLRRSRVVPVVDLTRRALRFEEAFAAATARVLRSGTAAARPGAGRAGSGGGRRPRWRREAVGVGSGASALQLALAGLGVGPGDEVVVPAFTAVPTASAVCAVGATPVPSTSTPGTAALDVGAAATAITPAHAGDRRRPPVRPAGAGGTAARRSVSRWSRTPPRRTARSAERGRARRPSTRSTRRRTSGASATAGWSSPPIPTSPPTCAGGGCTG